MRKLLFALFLFAVPAFGQTPKTMESTICFQDPQNNCLANGAIIMDLSQPATILSSGGVVAPSRVVINLDGNGKIPAGTVLWASDQLSPSGTSYLVQLENSNGFVVSNMRPCPWVITGASPVDLSQMTCTSIGATYPYGTTGPTGATGPPGTITSNTGASIGGSAIFKGPIPWTDITAYSARSIPANIPYAETASINSTSKTVTLSSADQYANGDYINILGAGSGNTACPSVCSAPSPPTVTPSVSSGPLGSNLVANSATGSTEYDYEIVWYDVPTMSWTPPSAVGSTLVGLATLGRKSVNITSIARSGTAATVTLAANHDLSTAACSGAGCAEVQVWQGSDASFTGFARITSASDATHFIYTTPGSTTYGASSSSTGGVVEYFLGNEVNCGTAPTVTSICVVYGRTSGSLAYLGHSRMGETLWDDWGSTISGNPARPWFVPATPPLAAGNNVLLTYITSGAGTTTLAVHDAASTSVSSQPSSLDMCTDIQSAANTAVAAGSGLYIPATNGANHYGFVVSSFCPLASFLQVRQVGNVYATNMIELQGQNNLWLANQDGANNGGGRIYYTGMPAFYLAPGYNRSYIDGAVFSSLDANHGVSVLSDASTYNVIQDSTFQIGSGGNLSYLGMGMVLRGASFGNVFLKDKWFGDYTNGAVNLGDTTAPNLMFVVNNTGAASVMQYNEMYSKGVAIIGATEGYGLKISNLHIQGPVNPVITTDTSFEQNEMICEICLVDSTAAPVFTMLRDLGWTGTVVLDYSWPGASDTGGFPPLTSGGTIADLQVRGLLPSHPIGQNFNVNGGGAGNINVNSQAGRFGTLSATGAVTGNVSASGSIACASQGARSPITGTGAAATYYTCTVPAGAIVAGGGIEFTVISKHTTGTASVQYTMSFGGTSTTAVAPTGASNQIERVTYIVHNAPGVSNSQIMQTTGQDSNSATNSIKLDTAAVDTTSAVTVNFQFNVANTDAITPEVFITRMLAP